MVVTVRAVSSVRLVARSRRTTVVEMHPGEIGASRAHGGTIGVIGRDGGLRIEADALALRRVEAHRVAQQIAANVPPLTATEIVRRRERVRLQRPPHPGGVPHRPAPG